MNQCSSCGGDCKSHCERSNVTEVNFRLNNGASNDMVVALKDCVYSFSGRVSVSEALGVIEIVKDDLQRELLTSIQD